jgi:hypothetical protein
MRLPQACVAAVLVLAICGCAGYRVGPVNGIAAGEKSVQFTPFENRTLEPRLGDAVTAQLRKELQRDGTYQLATRENGDIVVSGSLTRYVRRELSFVQRDIVTVRDYGITLTAQVTARERSSGKILFDQPVTGTTIIRVGTDLVSTERQALPLLTADLAKHVVSMLSEGAW